MGWSDDSCHLWGSIGHAMLGCEVKCFKVDPDDVNKKVEVPPTKDLFAPSEEEQGEICFRGRNCMMGYLANPKLGDEHMATMEKKNAETIDDEGWLHSGDKACMDERGMFRISGRYKEIIIGAGGENIAPVPIEDSIKFNVPAISNIIMIGDKRKFNVALLTLKVKGSTGELPGTNELDGAALDVNPDVKTVEEAMKDAQFIETISEGIRATNADGSVCPSNASKVQKFMILPVDFSVEGGELTPSLKLKRSVVEKRYAKQIDGMYTSKEMYVPFHP